MKVCANNRKNLALLAIDALDAAEIARLQAHVASCGGCRAYLQEMEQVTENVRVAESPEIDPSPFLHRRIRNRLLETRPHPVFPWRLLVPALAAMAFVMFVLPRSQKVALPPALSITSVHAIDPTVLNYQMAANQSLEKLDAILTEQGNRALTPVSTYRADSLGNSVD